MQMVELSQLNWNILLKYNKSISIYIFNILNIRLNNLAKLKIYFIDYISVLYSVNKGMANLSVYYTIAHPIFFWKMDRHSLQYILDVGYAC